MGRVFTLQVAIALACLAGGLSFLLAELCIPCGQLSLLHALPAAYRSYLPSFACPAGGYRSDMPCRRLIVLTCRALHALRAAIALTCPAGGYRSCMPCGRLSLLYALRAAIALVCPAGGPTFKKTKSRQKSFLLPFCPAGACGILNFIAPTGTLR